MVGLEDGAEGFRLEGLERAFLLFSTIALLDEIVGLGEEEDAESFLPGLETTSVTKPSVLFNKFAA